MTGIKMNMTHEVVCRGSPDQRCDFFIDDLVDPLSTKLYIL